MIIFVNASAARTTGALTILLQFLGHLSECISDQDKYVVFIHPETEVPDIDNVSYFKVNTSGVLSRLMWDFFGIKGWAKRNNIYPDTIISLQNMGVKYKGVSQLIYYHQPIPLSDVKWNLGQKNQRIYWCYKHIYPMFVKLFHNENCRYIVQTKWMKETLSIKMGIPEDKIIILRPDIIKMDSKGLKAIQFMDDKTHFFFPSGLSVYKNHIEIVNAIELIDKLDPTYRDRISVHFTIQETRTISVVDYINTKKLNDYFVFEGLLSFNNVLRMYKSCDALLFPSYIESYGLPLIEAAVFGIPLLCADIPNSRDVIDHYEGAKFIKVGDSEEWGESMLLIAQDKPRYSPFLSDYDSEWYKLFDIIKVYR